MTLPPTYNYSISDIPPPSPAAPRRPAKRGRSTLAVAISLAMLSLCLLSVVAVVVTGMNADNARVPADAAPFADVESEPAVEPTPSGAPPIGQAKPEAVKLGEGTYETAPKTDPDADLIAPGKWKIRTPSSGVNCYWARLSNFDGQVLGSIIANGNVSPGSTAIVNVKKSDAGLELRGDCEARK